MSWKLDKQWSDRFIPEIKAICGMHLIGEASKEEDAKHNTDLLVLTAGRNRIACRVRKYKYLSQYGDEFTIRAGRPRGTQTELDKIINGWGDYFIYGFADAQERTLVRWFLGNLTKLRTYCYRELAATYGHPRWERCYNYDNSSNFVAFPLRDMPLGFLVASHGFD